MGPWICTDDSPQGPGAWKKGRWKMKSEVGGAEPWELLPVVDINRNMGHGEIFLMGPSKGWGFRKVSFLKEKDRKSTRLNSSH